MDNNLSAWTRKYTAYLLVVALAGCLCCLAGCDVLGGYSSQSLYPTDVDTVYVEMFENQTYRRSMEYVLTDALAKRIEAETPYKIVSDRDIADTVISGQIILAREAALSLERNVGRVLEREYEMRAVVNWKDLTTGKMLIDNEAVDAAASYTEWLSQGEQYAYTLTANNLAQRIVERMAGKW